MKTAYRNSMVTFRERINGIEEEMSHPMNPDASHKCM